MNTAEIYRKATTSKQPTNPLEQKPDENVEEANRVVAEGMEKEQREKWLQHPLTIVMIINILSMKEDIIYKALSLSVSPASDAQLVKQMMSQVNTLNEIVTYINYGKN